MIKTLMIACAGMLIAASAQADQRITTLTDWFYEGGYFHKDQETDTWSETIGDGIQYHFVETARQTYEIDLYDASRNLGVILLAGSMYIERAGEHGYSFFRSGNFDDRRLYTYKFSGGDGAHLNLYPGKKWKWMRSSGYNTMAKEIFRNDSQIQVYDAEKRFTFSLMDTQAWGKFDGGEWFKLADGGWN